MDPRDPKNWLLYSMIVNDEDTGARPRPPKDPWGCGSFGCLLAALFAVLALLLIVGGAHG